MRDLNEIMVFTRVAQHGSFSKAASDLAMPVSTVSRKVSKLERRLGLTLIQRTTRKLSLTLSGRSYFEQCAELLRGLDSAETQITELQTLPEGLLRISIPVGMSGAAFMRRVTRFLADYPKLSIDLIITNEYVDLVSENVDLAIRFGKLADSNLISKRLGTVVSQIVASPAYLRRHGSPKHPRELENRECILFGTDPQEALWELSHGREKLKIKVFGRAVATDMNAVRNLALAGHGIARLSRMYYAEDVEKGKLVPLLENWSFPQRQVNAVYIHRKFLPARVSAFLQALQSWDSPYWTR